MRGTRDQRCACVCGTVSASVRMLQASTTCPTSTCLHPMHCQFAPLTQLPNAHYLQASTTCPTSTCWTRGTRRPSSTSCPSRRRGECGAGLLGAGESCWCFFSCLGPSPLLFFNRTACGAGGTAAAAGAPLCSLVRGGTRQPPTPGKCMLHCPSCVTLPLWRCPSCLPDAGHPPRLWPRCCRPSSGASMCPTASTCTGVLHLPAAGFFQFPARAGWKGAQQQPICHVQVCACISRICVHMAYLLLSPVHAAAAARHTKGILPYSLPCSVGMLMLQMAFPTLRQDNTLVTFNK